MLCKCGCKRDVGKYANPWKRGIKQFISGHNSVNNNPFKGKIHSKKTRLQIGKSCKESKVFQKAMQNPKRKRACAKSALKLKGKTFEEIYGIKEATIKRANLRKKRVHQKFPVKATSIERKLWEELQLRHIKFFKNRPILDCTRPDAFVEPNICIYADGDYWHNLPNYKKRDRRQNRILKKNGYKVFRFWEHEINSDKFSEMIGDILK